MGASGSSSSSSTKESALSKAQLAILQENQQWANTNLYNNLSDAISATDINSAESQAKLAMQSDSINTAFGQAQKSTAQSLAQQGLSNDSGVTAALNAQNNRDKASSLANAYQQTLLDNETQKQNYLSLAAGLAPQSTTSAQYHSSSSSSSWGASL